MLKAPERFAGATVVGSVKVADDPTEIPNKYIIIAANDGKAFSVHIIAFNGIEWVGGQGRYDLPWSRAVDRMAELAKMYMCPE